MTRTYAEEMARFDRVLRRLSLFQVFWGGWCLHLGLLDGAQGKWGWCAAMMACAVFTTWDGARSLAYRDADERSRT